MVTTSTKMVLVIGTILILFHFGGLLPDTLSDDFLKLFLHPEDITLSSFWDVIIDNGISLIATGVAVTIGTLLLGTSALAIRVATSLFLVNMALEMTAVFNLINDSVGNMIAVLIIGMIMIISIMAAIEWTTTGT